MAVGEKKGAGKSGHDGDGEFDSSKITMKRWRDFEQERRLKAPAWAMSQQANRQSSYDASGPYGQQPTSPMLGPDGGRTYRKHQRAPSNLGHEENYTDYP